MINDLVPGAGKSAQAKTGAERTDSRYDPSEHLKMLAKATQELNRELRLKRERLNKEANNLRRESTAKIGALKQRLGL